MFRSCKMVLCALWRGISGPCNFRTGIAPRASLTSIPFQGLTARLLSGVEEDRGKGPFIGEVTYYS